MWFIFASQPEQRHSVNQQWRASKYISPLFMMTSSNRNIFHVTGPLWGETTGHRWIPFTKASDVELGCFFYLGLNKCFSKQSRRRWVETSSRSLWRHRRWSRRVYTQLIRVNQTGEIKLMWLTMVTSDITFRNLLEDERGNTNDII